ncbi:hypothetical protein [Streptomyces yangpuensis]
MLFKARNAVRVGTHAGLDAVAGVTVTSERAPSPTKSPAWRRLCPR